MFITLKYDDSVARAPSGFLTALQTAADMLGSIIKDPINVTIQIGYGQLDANRPITGNTLAEASAASGKYLTYDQLVANFEQEMLLCNLPTMLQLVSVGEAFSQ